MPEMSFSRRAALGASLVGLSALAFYETTKSPGENRVRIGWSYYGLNLIAKQRGVFDKTLADQGLTVEWVGPFTNHADSLLAVYDGRADFSFGGSPVPAFAAMLAGAPLIFTQFTLQKPRCNTIIARAGSGINRPEDLVGRTVAVNNSGLGKYLLPALLDQHGVDRSKVAIVLMEPGEAGPAFASGKIDAWWMWSPGVDIARYDNHAHDVWLEARDLPLWLDYGAYAATADFVKGNRGTVQAVNAALKQEAIWVQEHARESEALIQKNIGYAEAVRDHFASVRRHWLVIPASDQKTLDDLQQGADWLTMQGLLAGNLRVSDRVANM